MTLFFSTSMLAQNNNALWTKTTKEKSSNQEQIERRSQPRGSHVQSRTSRRYCLEEFEEGNSVEGSGGWWRQDASAAALGNAGEIAANNFHE